MDDFTETTDDSEETVFEIDPVTGLPLDPVTGKLSYVEAMKLNAPIPDPCPWGMPEPQPPAAPLPPATPPPTIPDPHSDSAAGEVYLAALDGAERDKFDALDAAVDLSAEIRLLQTLIAHLAGDLDRNGKEIISAMGAMVRFVPLQERFTQWQRDAWEKIMADRAHTLRLEKEQLERKRRDEDDYVEDQIQRQTYEWLRRLDEDETGEVRKEIEDSGGAYRLRREEHEEKLRQQREAERREQEERWRCAEENTKRQMAEYAEKARLEREAYEAEEQRRKEEKEAHHQAMLEKFKNVYHASWLPPHPYIPRNE